MPLTLVVWSARPIQPRIRVASRKAERSPVARGSSGKFPQRGDDDFADRAEPDGISAARPDDLHKNVLGDLQTRRGGAVGAVGLIGDDAEFGGRESLPRPDPAAFQLRAQAGGQGGPGHERLAQRGGVDARSLRLVEQNFKEIGRPAIAVRT
jgi:hypothetical protein